MSTELFRFDACSFVCLQPVPVFITKCTQLYETVVVRHGLMLVGPTGGGKTNIMNTLQTSLTILAVSCPKEIRAETVKRMFAHSRRLPLQTLQA